MAVQLKHYLTASRAPRYSILFALPLLLLYEAASAALSGSAVYGVRNGADVLLKSLFVWLGGRHGLMVFAALLLGGGALLVWRDRRLAGEPMLPGVFAAMLAESALYAALFGIVVGRLTALLLSGGGMLSLQGANPPTPDTPAALDLPTQLVVSLGAGIYEELLFRVLLVGGLLWLLRGALKLRPGVSAVGAVLLGALIFSAFHYVGSLGDRFTVQSFTFRAIAGVAFSALYVTRGLGITAWTHALYDLGLTLLLSSRQ